MTTPTFVTALRGITDQLAEAGVRAFKVDGDGRVVLDGDEFRLILEPPAPPPAEPRLLTEAGAVDDEQIIDDALAGVRADLDVSRAADGDTSLAGATPDYAPHNGRCRFRDGVCEKCGKPDPGVPMSVATARRLEGLPPKPSVARVAEDRVDASDVSLPFAPTAPPATRPNPCPRCITGRLTTSPTDDGGTEVSCITCGYVPTRAVAPGEDPDILAPGVQRRRAPSHGKTRL